MVDYPDGRLAIQYNGVDLLYRTYDKRPQVKQAAIVENKRLGPILFYIAEQQKEARYVSFSQGAAETRPKESYVQGRIDRHPGVALRYVRTACAALSIRRNLIQQGMDG
jgi:hypothetical protein